MENETGNGNPLTANTLLKLLDSLYKKALAGVPHVSTSVEELAEGYREHDEDPVKAAKSMLRNQIIKCTAAGVITGIGGVLTLPVSIPVNVAGTLYMQLRMIACTALLAGYDLTNETVQAYAYAALAGIAPKADSRSLEDIRKLSAQRLLEKMGERGVLTLAKLIPGVGAGVNGGIDLVSTKAAADRAFNMFFEKKFAPEDVKNLRTRGEELYRSIFGR